MSSWLPYACLAFLIVGFLALVFGASRSVGSYDNESDDLAEVDEGALEGDLSAYVAEQNARAAR